MTDINYEIAYKALLDMWKHNMGYAIKLLTSDKEYDGYLLTGDHFVLNDFAGFCKKYGFETINMIIKDIAEDEPDEVSDQ